MTNNLSVSREEEKIPFGPSFQEYDNPFYNNAICWVSAFKVVVYVFEIL